MGFDINASLSGSSSATSGLDHLFGDFTGGDFIVGHGTKQQVPLWAWLAGLGALALVAVVYLVRR